MNHDTESTEPWSPAWGAEPEVDHLSDGVYVYYNGPLPKEVKVVGAGEAVLLSEPGLHRVQKRFGATLTTLTLYVNCTHWA